jgi:D-xylose transport system permease protein
MSDITQAETSEFKQPSLGEYVSAWVKRMRSGDLGQLPIIIGFIVIALIFGNLTDGIFYVERNFVNLLLQMSGLTAIAMGVVFILLIAEIDLSVAYVSAIGGVIMTLLLRESNANWPWWAAVGLALIVCTLIGLLHGLIITKASVPSFVVTLAGLMAWSGVVLILTTQFSTAGTVVIQNDVILGVANSYLPQTWSWIVFAVIMTLYAVNQISKMQSLQKQNLSAKPPAIILIQVVGLIVLVGLAIWYANQDRGVPTSAMIVLVFLAIWSFVATRTKFGRYVYAVGGNPEAARRAGINVDRIRIYVFMISGFMAGVGGIILASRLRSVSTDAGGGNLLLNAIAAAVIGGTSLFGGRGSVISALLGALIIQSVENGMGLMNWPSGVKFVVTGCVLLAAVLIDSFSRRSRASSGLA